MFDSRSKRHVSCYFTALNVCAADMPKMTRCTEYKKFTVSRDLRASTTAESAVWRHLKEVVFVPFTNCERLVMILQQVNILNQQLVNQQCAQAEEDSHELFEQTLTRDVVSRSCCGEVQCNE